MKDEDNKNRFINTTLGDIVKEILKDRDNFDISKGTIGKASINIYKLIPTDDIGSFCYKTVMERDVDFKLLMGVIG